MFTNCYGHALNLGVSDIMKQSPAMKDRLDTCFAVVNLISSSPQSERPCCASCRSRLAVMLLVYEHCAQQAIRAKSLAHFHLKHKKCQLSGECRRSFNKELQITPSILPNPHNCSLSHCCGMSTD